MEENFLSTYDILGVSETASLGEIHCAYKRLVRTVHPDRNQKIYLQHLQQQWNSWIA